MPRGSSLRREPVRLDRGRSAGDVLAGLFALIALLALLAGVPFALAVFFGSPLPNTMPTMDTLTQRLGTDGLLKILVFLVWLAWLQLTACVLVEAFAAVRGVGVPVRVPFAGGPQAIAHRLVIAALLLFTAAGAVLPAVAATRPPATAQAQPRQPELTPQQQAQRGAEQVATGLAEQVQPKHEVRKIYRVRPPAGRHHESLWEIAEKCLGDGRRYREIYQLNKGKPQPDGTRLTMASLIRPGWVLDMPDDATGVEIAETPQQRAEPYTGERQAVAKARQDARAEARTRHDTHVGNDKQVYPPPAQHQKPPAQKPPVQKPPAHSVPVQQTPEIGWPEELAVASLLAAGLLAALGRRRREQLWHRAFGNMLVRPAGEAAHAEQALRIGADTEATRLLDLGLRQLSQALAADDRTLPTVYGVHLGADSLDLWIAPADRNPPAPWQAHDDGQVWRLPTAALAEVSGGDFTDVLAPYPGLVSIGTNETGRILIDLEAAHGLIALHGPEDARRAALAAVAVELATNRWSDHMRITLVGFGEELTTVAPDRIRAVETLDEALPELEARAEEVRQALAASGADSVLTGRCRGVFGEAWMPHYLIMASPPEPHDAERLVALARTGRRMAAGYLVAGDVPGATWTWEVSADGRLRAGVLGFDVAAQLVPEQHYRAVVELFRTAGRVDGVPYSAPEEPSPLAMSQPGERPAVDVRLLGAVEIDAPGFVEEHRRDLCTEVLVYLAVHPEGVHPTVLGGAVWPRGVSASVRDATVGRVADWLGRDSRGRPNLYYDERGRVRLGSEVRVDWEVFRWLIWRSAAEPASEVAYLTYSLDLIRGPLLADRPRGRYAWLATEDLEYEAAARIADVAHRLVLMRLDEGDSRAAVNAARAGLRTAPDDEGLWRDLLRATHATGDHSQLTDVVDQLRRRVAEDPHTDQLQPQTEALVDELHPQWRQTAKTAT